MDCNTTTSNELVSLTKTNNAVDADIDEVMCMMQSCTVKDSDSKAPEPKAVQAVDNSNAPTTKGAEDIDTDVDMTTDEATQASDVDVDTDVDVDDHVPVRRDSFTQETVAAPAPPTSLEREAAQPSRGALRPQHQRLARLAGVEARSGAPAAFSLNRVQSASVQRGRAQLEPRPFSIVRLARERQRRSRLAMAAMEEMGKK